MGRYVGQCLTCQQVRDKPGDVRFHLKNIQSGYFNELVQYDHLKICPSDSNNTGILVIIDHFSKFAEAVPCSHHDYDAVTTSRLLLQKWFARHGTPTRMQSDNAPNLTAEVSNEFLKAAHVTKVTSTASHPRTQGLVERQNRTLLTLLRVFCSRRMRDWDQCLDEVMGAYNSTRHATTGFSPYMLTRGSSWSIIGHLEGEARNYIINKAESERDTPTSLYRRTNPNNYFQRRPMHLCPHVDVTGWTLDYALSFAQAAPARIISNLTIPHRVQTTNYSMPCCRYLLIQ